MSGPGEETPRTRSLRKRQRVWASLLRFLSRIELWFDVIFWGLRRRFGRLGPLSIVAYRGFGTSRRANVRGRVLEVSVLERSLPADSRFRNFRRMLRRLRSNEVPHAGVRALLGTTLVEGRTDDEGYFDLAIESPELAGVGSWKVAEVEVVNAPVRGLVAVRIAAEVLVPNPNAELGVVSDIDDTVLQTHVTQKLKMIWVTLSGSAFTRMPFEGTSQLYRALSVGASGHADNPVFYVSKSPWNLYDFLVDFMDYHELPRGPLLLRDIGLREEPPLDHKSETLRVLFETYPQLGFVLIGDSGERDPEIYLEIAARYPGRVRAIYIRDLGGKNRKAPGAGRAQRLTARAETYGTEMLWVEHASQALEHARARGLAR